MVAQGISGRGLSSEFINFSRKVSSEFINFFGKVSSESENYLLILQRKIFTEMIKRRIIDELKEWKSGKYRKPLVLRGARQVGKTTAVNEFGRSYDNYLYFNLEDENSRDIFERNLPLDDMISLLYALQGQTQREGTTLLFIDEIQNSPKTVALLRYFYEKRPDIHVVSAGSLLENVVDVQTSFPVGRVQYMAMHPCSFSEFVTAMGKGHLLQIMDRPELTTSIHSELMSLFNQYSIIGGMPEAVQRYADDRDLLAVDDVYVSLLQSYKDDVEKYVRHDKLQAVVRHILATGWKAAGGSITLGNFMESHYSSKEVGDAFRLLEKAMLLQLAYPTASSTLPVIPQLRRSPKLLWLDSGLVNFAAGIRHEVIGAKDILDVWRGHFGEQVVAQELRAIRSSKGQETSYWSKDKKNSAAEVDFVWPVDSILLPIEVKTGINSHLRSLHSFIDDSPAAVGVRVWSGPFSVDDVRTTIRKKPFRLINLPFYLVGNIEGIVRRYM